MADAANNSNHSNNSIMDIKYYRLTPLDLTTPNYLNKFMPIERALELLDTGKLWFANPECWNDPFESRFLTAKYTAKNSPNTKAKGFPWKDKLFCCCFTENSTSEASWKAYAKDDMVVNLTFKRADFIKVLANYAQTPGHKVFFDKVEYKRTNDLYKRVTQIPFGPTLKNNNFGSDEMNARLMLLKRVSFEYEKEFRAMIVKPRATKGEGIYLDLPTPLPSLIKGITFGPLVGDRTFSLLKDTLISKYGFNPSQIHQSELYKEGNQKVLTI